MTTLAVVAVSGAAGAVARYLVTYWVTVHLEPRWPFPTHDVDWGTHAVNISGSLAIGLLFGLGLDTVSPDLPRYAIATGFLGAYTTFSTWMYESWRLFEDGRRWAPLFNAGGAMVAGIAATALGFGLGAAIV
jgi:fluoride exporter